MPQMISLRNFRLASLSGHVIQVKAKEPFDCPDDVVEEAMKAGCAPANAEDQPFYDDLSRAKVDFHGDLRRSMVFMAISAIVKDNNVKHFDGGGLPKAAVISDRLGYDVTPKEVGAVYQIYLSCKSEGTTFELHPQAQHVMRVVEATDRAELMLLADEFGIEEGKAKGMSARDLRKLLLSKLNGAAAG